MISNPRPATFPAIIQRYHETKHYKGGNADSAQNLRHCFYSSWFQSMAGKVVRMGSEIISLFKGYFLMTVSDNLHPHSSIPCNVPVRKRDSVLTIEKKENHQLHHDVNWILVGVCTVVCIFVETNTISFW